MLQPQSYPELVARALVLDDEPFVVMVDDDNPWVEGLVLTTLVGVIAGLAQTIGSYLTAASLPDPNLALNAILQGWSQFASATGIPPTEVETIIRQIWGAATVMTGYAGGWSPITLLVGTPFLALLWWVFFGLVTFAAARAAGGRGTLSGTLGAAALIVAPNVLLLFSIVPFVAVSSALLSVWGLLIGYRAVQVSHQLPWNRAALVTLIPYMAALIVAPLLASAFALGYTAGGFR